MRLTGANGDEVLYLSISYDDIPDDANRTATPLEATSRFDDFRKAKAERSAARGHAARKAARVLRDNANHDGSGDERVRLDRAEQQYLGGGGRDNRRNGDSQTDPSDEGRLP